ncbi:hypothetical protein XANMN_03515 [Xanthomonas phaseoli pv. manihotis str. CIO151]|nr:hypothetical protein XANMN_03515 [Xanthomonas phaseoli pv. manihotis str. CIO151]
MLMQPLDRGINERRCRTFGWSGRAIRSGDTLKTRHGPLALSVRTDRHDWPLPAHRRGPLGGMDAAKGLTREGLNNET